MKSFPATALLLIAVFAPFSFNIPTSARSQQKKKLEPSRPPQLVRTTIKHELRRFGYGGTLTLVGAPEGAITVEAWPRSEVDISAEIQLCADTEQDLDRLAAVNGFLIDEDASHIRLLSTGTHDKAYMRSVAKKFPKTLLGLPWKIDYRIRVPILTDLEINSGRGAINITGVEGNIRISAGESETNLKLSSGTLAATIGIGKVNLNIPSKSWRRGVAEIRVAAGDITVELPSGFSGDIDAEILRTGKIEDTYGGLEAREKPGLTPQNMKARAGAGGAFLRFTVGDGRIYIKKAVTSNE